MAQTPINFIDNRLSISDGDEVKLQTPNPAYFLIAAVSADVTVSVQVIEGGAFRDIDPVISSGKVLQTSEKFPVGSVLKFTGGDVEVWAYGA